MTVEPLTGYTLTFVFLGALAILNFTVYFSTGRKRFFFLFCIYQLLWVLTLAGIILQTVVPALGVVLTNATVPFSLAILIEACAYESKRFRRGRLVLYGIIVLVHYSLFAFEQLFLHNFVFRSVFNSFMYCVCHLVALGFAVITGVSVQGSRTKGGVVIAVTLAIESLAWMIRGVTTITAAPVTGLLSQGLATTLTILVFPPLIYLLNAGFLARVIELSNKEKDSLAQRALIAEHDAMFADLLGNLNHELNTPLGNARIGASMLAQKVNFDEAPALVIASVNSSLEQMAEIIADRNRFLSRDANQPAAISTDELFLVFSRLMKRNMPGQARVVFELEPSISQFRSTWRFVFSLLFATTEVLGKGFALAQRNIPVAAGLQKEQGPDGETPVRNETPLKSETSLRGEVPSKIALRFSEQVDDGRRQAIEIHVRHDKRYLLANARSSVESDDLRAIRELLPPEVGNRMVWLAGYLQTPFLGSFVVRSDDGQGEVIVLSFCESSVG